MQNHSPEYYSFISFYEATSVNGMKPETEINILRLVDACQNNRTGHVKRFLNGRTSFTYSTIQHAICETIRNSHLETLDILLGKLIIPEKMFMHSLFYSIERNDTKMFTFLLGRFFQGTPHFMTQLLEEAAACGANEIFALILTIPKVDPSANNNRALFTAARFGHCNILQILLNDKRVDPSFWDSAAVCVAALNGHLPAVKLLSSHEKVQLNARDDEPLRSAVQNKYYDVAHFLLQQSIVNPSARHNEALKGACRRGDREMAHLLLRHPRVRGTEHIYRIPLVRNLYLECEYIAWLMSSKSFYKRSNLSLDLVMHIQSFISFLPERDLLALYKSNFAYFSLQR